jgi:hypothetical protein
MLQINHEDYKDYKPKNDRERIRHLRAICVHICGRVAGEAEAAYFMAARHEEQIKAGRAKRNTGPEV